ncbi:MATE family efflux transporter [Peptostreptococcus russellii]|uniref:MATE family efflux transporter n=1 Tax=Peptostreptococcus russellii TaxID=215200 RepID=UPI003F583191
MAISLKETETENKMENMPINKLIMNVSAPIMISMLVQSLYNLVDSIFVSKISEGAITAVALALPLQQFMMAVGLGTAVGVNSYLSRSLGAKDYNKANKAANNGIVLAFLSFVVFFFIGLFFSETIIGLQTSDAEIVARGPIYQQICCMGSLGIFMHLMFERILQSTGKTMYTMIAQCIGAVLNIVLDPILIFGWFGMPKMGLSGAAIATVVSQWIGAMSVIYFCLKFNKEVKISPKFMKLDAKIVKNIYKVGIPSIVMISIASVTVFCYNRILSKFSTTAIALLGIYYRLQGFIYMPIFGLNNGMVAIVAYNYGAKKIDRMKECIFTGLKYGTVVMVVGTIIMQVFPRPLLMMFSASEKMMSMGVVCFRIFSLSFILAGVSIICSGVFQAVGNGVLSMLISITRQLFILVPLAYIFSLSGNVDMVWWSMPIAEALAVILSVYYLRKLLIDIDKIEGNKLLN